MYHLNILKEQDFAQESSTNRHTYDSSTNIVCSMKQSKKRRPQKEKKIEKIEKPKRSTPKVQSPNNQNLGKLQLGRPSSQWAKNDRKLFAMFLIQYILLKPLQQFSWKRWKPEDYFTEQAKYIGEKTSQQCKSYDQRLKEIAFRSDGVQKQNLVQTCLKILVDEFVIKQRHEDVVQLIYQFQHKFNTTERITMKTKQNILSHSRNIQSKQIKEQIKQQIIEQMQSQLQEQCPILKIQQDNQFDEQGKRHC